jgi:hypothetical protein
MNKLKTKMIKSVTYTALILVISAFMSCKKCDRAHPELCKDFITEYDTIFVKNKYDCKKIETTISHEFTVCETDKTATDFGKPIVNISYDEVRSQAAYGCALPINVQVDCLGARDLKIKNLCNKTIQVDLIYASKNLAFQILPFDTVLGGSESNNYCTGQARLFVTLVKKL